MNCTQCQDLLFDYLEDLLNKSDHTAIEAHLQQCQSCQQILSDMQSLESCLTQAGDKATQTHLETDVLGAIVRGQKQRFKNAQPQSPQLRRSIMKSPFLKLALAAIVIVACILAMNLWTQTQSIALADVLARIEQVQAYLYQMSMTVTNSGDLPPGYPTHQEINLSILTAPEYGTKITMDHGDDPNEGMVQYLQPQNKRMLMIVPGEKQYIEMDLNQQMLEEAQEKNNDPRMSIEQILNCDYRSVGSSEIDGIMVEGFQTTDPAYLGGAMGKVDVTVWIDIETQLPVQMDLDVTMEGETTMHMQGTVHDIQWDIPMDADVFNPTIPEDYTSVGSGPIKMPDITEETTINGLRLYHEYLDQYPHDMGMLTIMNDFVKIMDSNTPAAEAFKESIKDLDEETPTQAMIELMMQLQACTEFYTQLVEDKEKDPAYYGDRVTPDMDEQVLMRWKISDSDDQYRVIFADLSTATVTAEELADLEAILPEATP